MRWPPTVKEEACRESYEYFDANIRELQKNNDGSFNELDQIYLNSDVDAFRHAYVSAIFTHEYGESVVDLFGRLNELSTIFSPGASPGEKNMDLWNNSVGRKYGKKFSDKTELKKAIHKALDNGELIITPEDDRTYEGASHFEIDQDKSIIVLDEAKTGRNETFYDVAKKKVLSRSELVAEINSGQYSGYSVRNINGVDTPVSKSDGNELNNLG